MKATTDAKMLATALAEVYSRCINEPYAMPDGRPLATEALAQTGPSEAYKDCWDTINDSIRSVSQAVLDEQALTPMRAAVTAAQPQYDKLKAARRDSLLDFDANKRRLDGFKDVKKDNERKGKHVGEQAITHDAKIERYESKKTISGKTYETINEEIKTFCVETKDRHDQLIDELVINAAVCQLEYYKKAAEELQKVVDTLPQERVKEVQERMDELLASGGHIIAQQSPAKRKSSFLGDMFGIGGGGSGKSRSASSSSAAAASLEGGGAASPSAPSADSDGNPFGDEGETPAAYPVQAAQAPPTPSSPAPANSPKKGRFVKAMYDHDAEADDELTFKVGDMVEVLETGDGGWWSGRCNGMVGDFPVDYVDTTNFEA